MSAQYGNSYSEHKALKRAWRLNAGRTLARGFLAGMALVSWMAVWPTGECFHWAIFPAFSVAMGHVEPCHFLPSLHYLMNMHVDYSVV